MADAAHDRPTGTELLVLVKGHEVGTFGSTLEDQHTVAGVTLVTGDSQPLWAFDGKFGCVAAKVIRSRHCIHNF